MSSPARFSDDEEEEEEGQQDHDLVMNMVGGLGDEFDCTEGAIDQQQQLQQQGDDDHIIDIFVGQQPHEAELNTVTDDKNYYAFVYKDIRTACDYFAQASRGKITSDVFFQELKQFQKRVVTHKDRNRPKKKSNGELCRRNGKPIYNKSLQSLAVVLEPVPEDPSDREEEVGNGYHYHNTNRGHVDTQICILIDFLEQERNSSINEIIRKGLSYAGARERDIITACGVDTLLVTNNIIDEFQSEQSGGDDDDGDDDDDNTSGILEAEQKKGVLKEYLGVISIKPNPRHPLKHVNHFPQDDATDSLVFNRELNNEGTGPKGWGNNAADPSRCHELPSHGDLNELIIREYWNRCGLEIKEERFPWNESEAAREMVLNGKDKTGTPVSSNIKGHYPNSFLPTAQLYKDEVNQTLARMQVERRMQTQEGMDALLEDFPNQRENPNSQKTPQERREEFEAELAVMKKLVLPPSNRFVCNPPSSSQQQQQQQQQHGQGDENASTFALWLRQQRKRKRGSN